MILYIPCRGVSWLYPTRRVYIYIYITSLYIYRYSIYIYIFKHISIFFLRWDKQYKYVQVPRTSFIIYVYTTCFNTVSKEDPESKSNVFLHLLAQLPSLWQFDEFAAICHGTSNGNLVRGNLMSKRPARHIAPAARGCGCTSPCMPSASQRN